MWLLFMQHYVGNVCSQSCVEQKETRYFTAFSQTFLHQTKTFNQNWSGLHSLKIIFIEPSQDNVNNLILVFRARFLETSVPKHFTHKQKRTLSFATFSTTCSADHQVGTALRIMADVVNEI